MQRVLLFASLLLIGCSESKDKPIPDTCRTASNPSGLLLEYNFHNQIVGSTFAVTTAGKVTHTERNCCPPVTNPVPQTDLDSTMLATLTQARAQIADATLVKSKGGATAEGSKSGALYLYDGEQQCTVKEQARNDAAGFDDISVASATAAVESVLAFVNGYVEQDLP